jgi:hypothetical protein
MSGSRKVLIVATFAVAVPNCIVPSTASAPAHFAWGGLIAPLLVSGMAVSVASLEPKASRADTSNA